MSINHTELKGDWDQLVHLSFVFLSAPQHLQPLYCGCLMRKINFKLSLLSTGKMQDKMIERLHSDSNFNHLIERNLA